MEWGWAFGAAIALSSLVGFAGGFISRALAQSARDEAEYFAPMWAATYADDAIDRHIERYHAGQKQQEEVKQRIEEMAMRAEVI